MPLFSIRPGPATRPLRRFTRLDQADNLAGPAQPGRRKSVALPWGVVGMLGLVLAIEATVARRWRDLSDPTSLSWQFADRWARGETRGRDVLFLGDSLVKHGLVPSVVERTSGLRGVNLAAARAPALFTYFVLRRALESGAHPSAVVIDTKPAVLMGGVEYNESYWPASLTPRECLELGRIAGKGPLAAAVLAARVLPSLRSRLEVRAGIMAAITERPDPIREINRVLWRNWTVNDGANVASMDSSYQGVLSPELAEKLHPDRWYVDHSNAEGIERLLKLAAGRNVRVFWLLPPISPGLQRWRERSGSEAKYEQFVRSYALRYPGVVTVLDARRIAREASLYVDATHLSGRGAVVLSRAVGEVLKADAGREVARGSGDWVTLQDPSAEPPAVGPHLEDVERSREIVRGTAS